MNVYCELLLDRLRIKIHGDEIAFQVTPDFYTNKMSHDSLTSTRIRGYVQYNKSDLNFFQRLKYPFILNRVFILVNQEVQEFVTIRQIHDFATKYMEGRSIFIIPKPGSFDSSVLEDIQKIRTEYINGRRHGDTVIAQLKAITSTPRMTQRRS